MTPNGPINLIIAVSFGLFVPPRILKATEYGGLNVHPSLLPEYEKARRIDHKNEAYMNALASAALHRYTTLFLLGEASRESLSRLCITKALTTELSYRRLQSLDSQFQTLIPALSPTCRILLHQKARRC